jgi:hypothetical protein
MSVFRFWSRAYVLHLEDEIQWLRGRLDMERQRAEIAIDNLVSVRIAAVGSAPVQPTMQPLLPPTAPEAEAPRTAEEAMRRILADPEFLSAGSTEG